MIAQSFKGFPRPHPLASPPALYFIKFKATGCRP